MKLALVVAAGTVALAVVACDHTPSTAPNASSVSVVIVSGNGQSGSVSAPLAQPIRIRALDPSGKPVSNFLVDFVVTAGGGSVFDESEITDSQGYADEQWTLGPWLGPQTLEVRSVNATTGVATTYATFTATALPPHNIQVVASNSSGIYIMNADGTGIHQLTSDSRDYAPDLSPDHKKITFFSTRSGSGPAVYLMNVDGSNVHQITPAFSDVFLGIPQYSPDGTWILFMGPQTSVPDDASPQVYVVDTTGAAAPGSGWYLAESAEYALSWTADGRRILFSTDFLGPPADLFTTNLAYPGEFNLYNGYTQLTKGWLVGACAASPDGQHVAFIGAPETELPGPEYLYVMDPDGTNIKQITTTAATGTPTWSPDSRLIGTDQGMVNIDGSGLTLINGGGSGRFAWR